MQAPRPASALMSLGGHVEATVVSETAHSVDDFRRRTRRQTVQVPVVFRSRRFGDPPQALQLVPPPPAGFRRGIFDKTSRATRRRASTRKGSPRRAGPHGTIPRRLPMKAPPPCEPQPPAQHFAIPRLALQDRTTQRRKSHLAHLTKQTAAQPIIHGCRQSMRQCCRCAPSRARLEHALRVRQESAELSEREFDKSILRRVQVT